MLMSLHQTMTYIPNIGPEVPVDSEVPDGKKRNLPDWYWGNKNPLNVYKNSTADYPVAAHNYKQPTFAAPIYAAIFEDSLKMASNHAKGSPLLGLKQILDAIVTVEGHEKAGTP